MSDDFDDIEDIELNDDILKALQDTEDRYTLTTASQIPASNPNPVVPKPAAVPRRNYIHPDDTPDISIALDGSYMIHPSASQSSHPPSRNARTALTTQYLPRSRPPPSSARPLKPSNSTSTHSSASLSKLRARVDTADSESAFRTSAPPKEHVNGQPGLDVQILMTQVQQLQAEREAIEKQLEEARNFQFMREGEITTLRRAMEKQATSHSETLSKLRTEKLDAEQRRAAIEVEMTAEIDRLKTRFTFKQQEYETATLRLPGAPPSTVRRGRRIQYSQQPTPGPSRNQPFTADNSFQFDPASQAVPVTPLMSRGNRGGNKIDPIPFPGFHDAFAPRPKSASKDKGKGRSAVPGTPLMPQALRPASQLALAGSFETGDLAAPSNALNPDDAANELPDAIADTVEDVQFAPSFEWSRELFRLMFTRTAPARSPSKPRLAIQVLLSVSFAANVDNKENEYRSAYQTACAELLALFGRASDQDDVDIVLDPAENQEYQTLVKGFGSSLLTILNALICGDRNQDEAICAALCLIDALILLLPSFCDFFLSTATPCSLLSILAGILVDYRPEVGSDSNAKGPVMSMFSIHDRVGLSALSVVETLAWNASDVTCSGLIPFINESDSLASLLRLSQPFWLIQRTVQLLVLFAIRSQLAACLLSPSGEVSPDANASPSLAIKQMCDFVADPGSLATSLAETNKHTFKPSFEETWDLMCLILTFLVTLGVVHTKGMRFLELFPSLTPSLILCMSEVARWLWEEPSFALAPECDHDALIGVLVPGLQILHHLFYGPALQSGAEIPQYADLPHILMHSGTASGVPASNALDHTYIVTMARLGYADVPEWLGRERIRIVDDIAELARELLELFVGGPEGDLIVEAYVPPSQGDPTKKATYENVMEVDGNTVEPIADDDEGSETQPLSDLQGAQSAMEED